MSAARKQLPPPSNDLGALLRNRHVRTDDPAPPTAAAVIPEPTPATEEPAPSRRAAPVATDRRSWYMPRATADALAAALDELHWETHRPKKDVLAALVAVALDHKDEVRGHLS